MKQIVSFNIARLRVEEDFGFLKLIATETDNLPKNGEEDRPGELSMTASVPTTLTTSVTTFKNAVDAFDNALKDSASTRRRSGFRSRQRLARSEQLPQSHDCPSGK